MARAQVRRLNPESLHRTPAFSQVATVEGDVRTVFVGGQNAVDADGEVVGQGDVGAQAAQVLRNVEAALAAGGAGLEHVIVWRVAVVEGQPLEPGFAAFQESWGDRGDPPLISVVKVAGLAHPDFLVEMEAIAAVPVSDA